MKLLKKFALLGSLAVCLISTGCSAASNNGSLEMIVQNKKIVVGTEATYEPFEFVNSTGDVVGMDIELAKLVAQGIGKEKGVTIELEVINMTFDGLLGALQAGTIDMIAAAYSVNPERADKVDFSNSYISFGTTVVVGKDSSIDSIDDLIGKTVGAQLGTTMETKALDVVGESGNVVSMTSNANLINSLIVGNLDAVILEDSVAQNYAAKNNTTLKMSTAEFVDETADEYAFAVQKGQSELLEIINTVIDNCVSSGSILELYEAAVALAAN